jgi:TusE/DsrC/DsvC family sulfur relay protein
MNAIKQTLRRVRSSQPERDHAQDLAGFSREQARATARELGISLTDDHWRVIDVLREHYGEHGPAPSGRELSDMLDMRFAAEGGRRWLRRLFPDGPVSQGMQIAGLPVPPRSEDSGFGVAY